MEISESQTRDFVLLIQIFEWRSQSHKQWEFVCNSFTVEEFMDLELRVVTQESII